MKTTPVKPRNGSRSSAFRRLLTSPWAPICALGVLLLGCDPRRPRDGDPLNAPMCGGLAGIECPGSGVCVDDPRDDCDPERSGADCFGVCECSSVDPCEQGTVWDGSPDVCACVQDYDPCIVTLCPVGTQCQNQEGQGVCVAVDGGVVGELCGDSRCGAGQVCCNASCGICTEPGGVCIQIACE